MMAKKLSNPVTNEEVAVVRNLLKRDGAIRSIKKRYSDHKLFTADCDVMRQRLF
jgi:hypothetical protein